MIETMEQFSFVLHLKSKVNCNAAFHPFKLYFCNQIAYKGFLSGIMTAGVDEEGTIVSVCPSCEFQLTHFSSLSDLQRHIAFTHLIVPPDGIYQYHARLANCRDPYSVLELHEDLTLQDNSLSLT